MKTLVNSNRGFSVLVLVMMFGMSILIGQIFMITKNLASLQETKNAQMREVRVSLLSMLDDLISHHLVLRNSRFSINSELLRCMLALPTPCSEAITYDMVLFSPNPPVSYHGVPWPAAPAGLSRLAGGLSTNKMLFNAAGGNCDSLGTNEPSDACPLQAIIRFRPLCGGTLFVPDIASGGVCLGPANGFEFIVGVGVFSNGNLVYHGNTSADGDSRVYRISATNLKN